MKVFSSDSLLTPFLHPIQASPFKKRNTFSFKKPSVANTQSQKRKSLGCRLHNHIQNPIIIPITNEVADHVTRSSTLHEHTPNTTMSPIDLIIPPQAINSEISDVKQIIEKCCHFPNSFTKFILNIYNSFAFLKQCEINEPSLAEIEMRKLKFPCPIIESKKGMKIIAFDIDETLLICKGSEFPGSTLIQIHSNESVIKAFVQLRPNTREILSELTKHFEIIAFTAGKQEYANAIVKMIDPEKKIFDRVLSREHCFQTDLQNAYIKDLRILGRNLKDVAIVDNCVIAFCFQLENGIPIYPFDGEKNDHSLMDIYNFLMENKNVDDIRVPIIKRYELKELVNCNIMNMNEIRQLYSNDELDDFSLTESVKRKMSQDEITKEIESFAKSFRNLELEFKK